MDLTTSLATEADVPELLSMMEEFNRLERIPWTRQTGETPLRVLLGDRRLGVVGIFREAAAAIGYFVVTFGYDLEWNGRDAFLTELFLVEDRRARGRGPTLMAELERIAKEHDVRALHLMVRTDNAPALRLYRSQGYTSPERVFMTKVMT
jgi:ribosomal protein S18 acetylase RimI-like enzyme